MPRSVPPKPERVPADGKPTLDAVTKNIGFTPKYDSTIISAAEHASPHAAPEDRMAKLKRVYLRGDSPSQG
jgi:hypothetical protein